MPDPTEPAVPVESPPVRRSLLDQVRDSPLFKALDFAGKLVVPATIVGWLANAGGLQPQHVGLLGVATALVIAIVLVWNAFFAPRPYMTLMLGLALGAAVTITTSSLTLFGPEPTAGAGPTPEAGLSHAPGAPDLWNRWEVKVRKDIQDCQADGCVARALAEPPPAQGEQPMARLHADLRAGVTLLRDPRVAQLLDRKLGIKTSFLGTGLAEPQGSSDYGAARVAEFLVPNFPDSQPHVLTWILDPIALNFNQSVRDVVEKRPPSVDRSDRLDHWRSVIRQRLQMSSEIPAVIRINQFPRGQYVGNLGRAEAARVFALHLGQVWNMNLSEAAKYSGSVLGPTARSGPKGDTLFVWVLIPTHPDEVVLATWRNVLSRAGTWIR